MKTMKQPLTTVLMLMLSATVGYSEVPIEQPNLIYILTDDQGYGDVSALNPEGKIETLNIDRLAAEGMTFTDAHSSSSVCTPTRYNVLTGRYNWRTHLKSGVLDGYGGPLIAEERLTWASMLQAEGYQTAMIGKWHLGMELPGALIVDCANREDRLLWQLQ